MRLAPQIINFWSLLCTYDSARFGAMKLQLRMAEQCGFAKYALCEYFEVQPDLWDRLGNVDRYSVDIRFKKISPRTR